MTTPAQPDRPNRRARRMLLVASCVLTLALATLAGCGSGSGQPSSGGADAGSGTAAGADLYAANCASCHGVDLRGTDQGPSQLSIVYEPDHHGDDAYRSAITQGVRAHHWNFGDMPAVPGLDDDEIDAVIDFIRAEQQRQGFEPYERP